MWRIFAAPEDLRESAKEVYHSLGARWTDGLQGGQASIRDYRPLGNVTDGIVGCVVC